MVTILMHVHIWFSIFFVVAGFLLSHIHWFNGKTQLADLRKMLLGWNNDLLLQGDKNGSTPLHYAIIATLRGIGSTVFTSLPDAMYQQDNNGSFPTHVAASVGATWVINDFLVKSNNCADLHDARGRTFLHVAVVRMKIGTVDYVCRNIALSWILNMQDKDGNTALHLAVRTGNLRIFCSLFTNRQVQLNLINEKGQTPRDIAHYNLPGGMYKNGENEAQILKILEYVGAERGVCHQGFLNEYGIDQARQDELRTVNQVKEGTQSRCIVSVLIATVTFGAMFAMPGGYIADGPKAGSPTLAGKYCFDAFILSNALAFALSATAVVSLMFSGDPTVYLGRREMLFRRSIGFIVFSVLSMSLAFTFGTYTVLYSVAPTYGGVVLASLLLVFIYHFWEGTIKQNAVLVALCKRKGICYGIVACPITPLLYVSFLAIALSLVVLFTPTTHTGGKVEPPAQAPTPFA